MNSDKGKMEERMKAEEKKIGVIEAWLRKHRLQFTGATRHPFVLSIRDGTTDMASFKTWLVLTPTYCFGLFVSS